MTRDGIIDNLVFTLCLILFAAAWFAAGWRQRGWYEDREFARIERRLCEEHIFCPEPPPGFRSEYAP